MPATTPAKRPETGLIAFLNARLDEDEAAAKAWLPFGNPDAAAREHVARHDPARVLREVAAKRAIVQAYQSQARSQYPDASAVDELRDVVQTLATVYSDHPDYREEWKS